MGTQALLYLLEIITVFTACDCQQIHSISCCRVKLSQHCNSSLLDQVLDLPSNSLLELTDGTCNLSHTLSVSNVSNVTIRGQGSQLTTISCHHANAGLVFNKSFNIQLLDLTIDSCGVVTINRSYNFLTGNASRSVIIANTSNVVLRRLVLANGNGYGLLIVNSFSSVLLDNITFQNNKLTGLDLEYSHGGGGLTIVFMPDQKHGKTNYTISNCTFKNNSANPRLQTKGVTRFDSAKMGGGMSIYFLNKSTDIQVVINSCHYTNNTAMFGGGLYVKFSGNSSGSLVTVSSSGFVANSANVFGGGGANVGFDIYKTRHIPTKNSVLFEEVFFQDNVGYTGGGVQVFTASVDGIRPEMKLNYVTFYSCNFTHNSAAEGAAMIVTRVISKLHGMIFITGVTFKTVRFFENFPMPTNKSTKNAVFFVSGVTVKFMDLITFSKNQATALYSASALLIFEQYSTVKFLANSGDKGGAILLAGDSRIQLSDDTHFEFVDNSASLGGAIGVLSTQGFTSSDYCFLSIETESTDNITLSFDNNLASTGIGHNIFSFSLFPCLGLCQYRTQKPLGIADIFTVNCIGNFSFTKGIYNGSIATLPSSIGCSPCDYHPIPGFSFHMNISQTDELGNDVGELFPLTATIDNISDISFKHRTISQNTLTLYGSPGKSSIISIQNIAPIVRKSFINFTLGNCPPGFTLQDNVCKCSNSRETDRYFGIGRCQDNAALINIGYWVGYVGNESEDTLFTGACDAYFCNFNNEAPIHGHFSLPDVTTSKETLERAVCGNSRQGVLCTKCAQNFTLLYHSRVYECRHKEYVNCSYGFVLYVVSELLPVTVLFLVILTFNISLTSGALCIFVLYAQVLDSQFVDAFGTAKINNVIIRQIFNVLRIVYGSFNLSMLDIEELSFCLIGDATVMDLLMFRYATVVYAILLVVVTVLVLRLHSCYYCVKLGKLCGRRNIRGSIVDGLSAFLVLCYFVCARTTLQILIPVSLRGKGEIRSETVPLFLGDTAFFGNGHLPFALSAIFCLLIVIIPPPCILTLEPVLTKLFSLRIWNTKVADYYTKMRMSCLPFLDSFQGSFKDRYRFFSGLYFAYRVAVTLTYFSPTVFTCYIALEIILFVIIFTHMMFLPHKKNWHNILELGILLDLLFVNTLTLLNYAAVVWGDADSSSEASPLVCLQVVAVFLPIFYLVVYAAAAVYHNAKCFNRNANYLSHDSEIIRAPTSDSLESMGFPARLLESKADYDTF